MASYTPFQPVDSGRRTNPYGPDIVAPPGMGNEFLGIMQSTNDSDLIKTGGGTDDICAAGGDDKVIAGADGDEVDGGSGNDWISGDEEVFENPVSDGDDILLGGSGNDTVVGQGGDDQIWGEEDDDVLFGGTGEDILNGGSGDDTLVAGDGNDALIGGDDNDEMDGGSGADTMDGGTGNDTMDGGDHDDHMSGGAGNDVMDGGSGDDVMDGGSGSDVMQGGSGADCIKGGLENDTIWGDGIGPSVLSLPVDIFAIASATGGDIGGHSHSSLLAEVGDYHAEKIKGLAEFDIAGLDGPVNQAILSFTVNHTGGMYGQPGADFLIDVLSYQGNNAEDVSDYQIAISDVIGQFSTNGLSVGDMVSYDVTSLLNTAIAHDDVSLGVRLQQATLPNGGAYTFGDFEIALDFDGADTLIGGEGNDVIHGGGGGDQIAGNNGDDVLYGDDGDDRIVPGRGNDTMTGGAGSDTFEFHQNDVDLGLFVNAIDVILDWDANNGTDGDADVLRLCGQPEFVPIKIQFGAFFGNGNQLPDDVMILLSNGQIIYLDDAALVDGNIFDQEFEMGIRTFTQPLQDVGNNQDDFDIVHLPNTCPPVECDDPDLPDDLPPPDFW